jgi:fructokinase
VRVPCVFAFQPARAIPTSGVAGHFRAADATIRSARILCPWLRQEPGKKQHAWKSPIDPRARWVGDTVAARKFTVVGLGEILWDIFPEGKQLGGAPANFAHITNLLGDHGIVASRIGNDTPGKRAVDKLSRIGLDITCLQFDFALPTGTVQVSVNKEGEPNYKIAEPVAWDHFEWTREWKSLARRADAVCFGSLAQRAPQSRATIQEFLNAMDKDAARVFDVNLRQAFYTPEIIAESLKSLTSSSSTRKSSAWSPRWSASRTPNDRASAQRLRDDFQLELVCVTRGANGSILCSKTECDVHPGFHVKVADMVGAGDAFTAGLVRHYLRKSPLAKMNDAANRLRRLGSQPKRRHAHPRQAPAKESARRHSVVAPSCLVVFLLVCDARAAKTIPAYARAFIDLCGFDSPEFSVALACGSSGSSPCGGAVSSTVSLLRWPTP